MIHDHGFPVTAQFFIRVHHRAVRCRKHDGAFLRFDQNSLQRNALFLGAIGQHYIPQKRPAKWLDFAHRARSKYRTHRIDASIILPRRASRQKKYYPTGNYCLTFFHPTAKKLERVTGIEPVSEAWEASILPLNYTRNLHHSTLKFVKLSFPACRQAGTTELRPHWFSTLKIRYFSKFFIPLLNFGACQRRQSFYTEAFHIVRSDYASINDRLPDRRSVRFREPREIAQESSRE